jgi:hypothetical protein
MSKQEEVVIKVIESKLSNFKIGWFSAYDTLKGMVALYGADKVQEALTEIIGGLTPRAADECPTCAGLGFVNDNRGRRGVDCSDCNGSGIRR